ncbi:MAG: chromosome segregation protein SMC [Beijerinckiaceae bacterium]|nr:chromosome segregation protein SMC [Beijerinckiaceae bacterium]
MKFERLRLQGFKTFVDPTELVIAPGLTGIVGPNGCGKSNLVEALRWAMGETSSKSLRGGEMDDVIFAGAGTRPGRNHAEVSIRLADPPQDLPGHLHKAEVLEVTRKIVREQGSTFRINGREVRARDVQILFADAASGARSPSLVRQGQISEIINAKPQHRRRILEDAAGTAGLHARRHEAELRLRQAEENLIRAEDVLGELDRQAGDLKKQARQAERYKALQAEIRALDLRLLASSLERARQEADAARQAHDEAIRTVATTTVQQGETERDRAVKAHELEQARAKATERLQALQALLVTRETLDGEITRIEQRLKDIISRRAELDRDREAAARLLGDAESAQAGLTAEAQALAAEIEKLARDEQSLLAAREQAEAARNAEEQKLRALTIARAEAEAAERAADQRLQVAASRTARLAAQADEAERALAALTADSAALADYTRMQAELDRLATDLAAATTRSDEAEAKARAARDAEQGARPKLAEAERLLQRLETEARTIRKLVDTTEPGLWTPAIDQIVVEPGYETALAAALGEDLDAAIEWGAPRHWGERAMEGEPSLPADVKPLISVVKAPAPLHLRLRQIGVCARADGKRLQALLQPGQRLVSREGDLWRWDGFAARGDAPSAAARRLAERNRLDELEREAREAKTRRDAARETLDRILRAMCEAQETESAAREAVRRITRQREDANAALQREMRRTEDVRLRLEGARLRRETLANDLIESRREEEEARAARAALPALAEDPALQAQEALLSEMRQAENAARDALARLFAARNAAEQRLAGIGRERAAWDQRAARARESLGEHEGRRTRLEEEFERLEGEPAELSARRRGIAGEIEAAEAARKTADDTLAQRESAARAAEDAARQAAHALSQARELSARLEVARENADSRLIHVIQTIEGEIEGPIEGLANRIAADPRMEALSPEAIEARLRDLKQDRDRLGAVNLRADTELAEIETRYSDLTRERAEIEEAIRKFRRAIESLNSEGRARLREAFEAVQGHFTRLFARLFGGGTAELHLVEADDPLEAGLEIIARPPGKKPQLLSLLSGGEQALTATALIFAVFLTNPAPICVLDEVDAPLDDSNVERLCALLHDIAGETGTRFLVITHNPISMAEMDRLFGVTMAERGVSQLVSVDLAEAERLAEAG